MKCVLLMLCCCLPWLAPAQSKTAGKKTHRRHYRVAEAQAPPQIFTYVEQRAEFPGGRERMLAYVNTHLRYPDVAREAGVEGTVMVQFAVGKDGMVTETRVMKSVWVYCDKEALRVVNSMPAWTPAKRNGQPMKSYFLLPVKFMIED